MQKGKPGYKKIVKIFGEEILDSEKEIKRKELGSIVFANKKKRVKLEQILAIYIFLEILYEIY